MFKFKAISAMEKVMLTDGFDRYEAITAVRGLKGERVAFQIQSGFKLTATRATYGFAHYTLRSPLRAYTKVSRVGYVLSELPSYPDARDEDYISYEPGAYPDVMYPLKAKEQFVVPWESPVTLMVTVDIPEEMEAGEYPLYFTFTVGKEKRSVKVMVQVEDLAIQKNDLLFTQWFHCDCIADVHKVKVFSEKHWKIVENYIKTAARTGMTMILTPIFTPPLDTLVGGERPTVQLVKIKKTADTYSFDFTLLKRWVELCHKHGIRYFEMAHLFTQWGANFCPKIVVEMDGKEVKEFGWHVQATSDLYKNFLDQFLPALTKELRQLGIADNCYFHISDEPNLKHLESYTAAKEMVKPHLKGFKLIDALSNIDFYQNGLVETPVPANNHIEPFMEADIDERWTYYCCSQNRGGVANRFFAMPQYRNRAIGVQMFRNDIVGFLHWGHNFYYSAKSLFKIDPYRVSDAMHAFPSGDAFSVYPYENGSVESIRTVVFYEALQDRMLLKMLADKIGLEETKKWVDEECQMTMDFKHYPKSNQFFDTFHDKILDRLTK